MFTAFEMAGRFGGFVFTDEGKRRMLLHRGEDACLLKVPRLLRRRIIGKFHAGELIRVAGTEETEPGTDACKRVVSQVLPDSVAASVSIAPPAVACVVRVCSKKNCWRNGGRELWHALGQAVEAGGHQGSIELRQVGCLDRCKQAPNVDCGRHAHARCSPDQAGSIIAQAAGPLSRHTVET